MGDGAEAQDLMHHQQWQCSQHTHTHTHATQVYVLSSQQGTVTNGQQARGGACRTIAVPAAPPI